MKKIFGVCLGLLLCFMLTACGGSESEAMKSDIIVHVEVNPSFDIHVNDDGTIKSVDCLNDDAQTVYAEMDLTGVVYEDGFKQLLTAIHDAGFFLADAKITIDIEQKNGVTYEVAKVTDEVLEDFNTNVVAIESNVSDKVVEEQSGGLGEVFTLMQPIVINVYSEDNAVPVELYVDGENRISSVKGQTNGAKKFAKSLGLEGLELYNGITKLFNAMCEKGYLDESKSLRIEVNAEAVKAPMYKFIAEYEMANDIDFSFPSVVYGSSSTVINGEMFTVSKEDGIWYEKTETYQNGVLRKLIIESENGYNRYEEEHYDENGVITSYVAEEADGTYHNYEFDANGMPLYQVITSGDGQMKQEQFFENGVRVKQIITSPEYIFTTIYDASGNMIDDTVEYFE